MLVNAAKCPEMPQRNLVEMPRRFALTAKQKQAISLLCVGKTVTDTAKTIGVDRRTLQRWQTRDPFFQSEYNQQRQELFDSMQLRIQGLMGKALGVMDLELESGNWRVALALLQLSAKMPHSKLETDPEQLVRVQAEKLAVAVYSSEPFVKADKGNESIRRLAHDISTSIKEEYDVKDTLEEFI